MARLEDQIWDCGALASAGWRGQLGAAAQWDSTCYGGAGNVNFDSCYEGRDCGEQDRSGGAGGAGRVAVGWAASGCGWCERTPGAQTCDEEPKSPDWTGRRPWMEDGWQVWPPAPAPAGAWVDYGDGGTAAAAEAPTHRGGPWVEYGRDEPPAAVDHDRDQSPAAGAQPADAAAGPPHVAGAWEWPGDGPEEWADAPGADAQAAPRPAEPGFARPGAHDAKMARAAEAQLDALHELLQVQAETLGVGTGLALMAKRRLLAGGEEGDPDGELVSAAAAYTILWAPVAEQILIHETVLRDTFSLALIALRELLCWRAHVRAGGPLSAWRSREELTAVLERAFGAPVGAPLDSNVRSALAFSYDRVAKAAGLVCPPGPPRRRARRGDNRQRRQARQTPPPPPEDEERPAQGEDEGVARHGESARPPRWQGAYNVRVQNTFLSVDARSETSSDAGAASEPAGNGVRRRRPPLPALLETCDGGSDGSAGSESGAGEWEEAAGEAHPAQHPGPKQCSDPHCRVEDPDGYEDRGGEYYCERCWRKHRWPEAEEYKQGDWSKRFDVVDPVADAGERSGTRVEVFPLHCLDALRFAAGLQDGFCLVAMASEMWIERSGNGSLPLRGLLQVLCRSSDFAEAADQGHLPVPEWGGLFVPEVTIRTTSVGRDIEPFTCPVAYAMMPWGPDDRPGTNQHALAQLRHTLREKVLNILRECWRQGQKRLVVGSRFSGSPPDEVAQVFREVLLDAGDVCRRFERVVFAFDPKDPAACEAQASFERAFAAGV